MPSATPMMTDSTVVSVPDHLLYGRSAAMAAVRSTVERVASAKVPVLLRGESGTGKDVLARAIHQRSPWSAGPFVRINCPAIPGALLESELFGYERGAFTGAVNAKAGWVELADRGTLFLDEVSELDLPLQSKLLQLLQDGGFARIGGQEDRVVDIRTISASNRDLDREVAAGAFRRDLLYRINAVTIALPPLRERSQDIPYLAAHFLQKYSRSYEHEAPVLTNRDVGVLLKYHWPGNIRELENCMRRCILLDSEQVLSELAASVGNGTEAGISTVTGNDLRTMTRRAILDVEKQAILAALHVNRWNRKAAARDLNISYRALFYKMEQAGIRPKRAGNGRLPAAAPASPATISNPLEG